MSAKRHTAKVCRCCEFCTRSPAFAHPSAACPECGGRLRYRRVDEE